MCEITGVSFFLTYQELGPFLALVFCLNVWLWIHVSVIYLVLSLWWQCSYRDLGIMSKARNSSHAYLNMREESIPQKLSFPHQSSSSISLFRLCHLDWGPGLPSLNWRATLIPELQLDSNSKEEAWKGAILREATNCLPQKYVWHTYIYENAHIYVYIYAHNKW